MAISLNTFKSIAKMLPRLEGSKGTLTLTSKQIEQIAAKDARAAEYLGNLTQGINNPTLEIAYKAKSNYAIAGLQVRQGKDIVRKGAVSFSPDKNGQIGKYHYSNNDGEIVAGDFRYVQQGAENLGKKAVKGEFIAKKDASIKKVDKTNTNEVIPGVLPPKPPVTINTDDMLQKLNKFAKTDRAEFERLRKQLSGDGFQVYFDPHTGKLNIIEAKDMEEVVKMLRLRNLPKLPSPQSYLEQGRMSHFAEQKYKAVKNAEFSPEKMHAYRQKELDSAFANFEDKVPLNKREWSEILHQQVDDVINSRFIG